MTKEEIVAFQAKEKEFASTPIGAAFYKFKNRLVTACAKDAMLEYLDKGEISARKTWVDAQEAEREFRLLLENLQ